MFRCDRYEKRSAIQIHEARRRLRRRSVSAMNQPRRRRSSIMLGHDACFRVLSLCSLSRSTQFKCTFMHTYTYPLAAPDGSKHVDGLEPKKLYGLLLNATLLQLPTTTTLSDETTGAKSTLKSGYYYIAVR